jgi:hypothetical protein
MAPDQRPTLSVFHAPHVPIRREQPWRDPASLDSNLSYHNHGATETFHWSPKSEITAIES